MSADILAVAKDAGMRESLYAKGVYVATLEQIGKFRELVLRQEWLPIASAPKNMAILVGAEGRRPAVAEWSEHKQQWVVGDDHYDAPTHWQHRPPNPPSIQY